MFNDCDIEDGGDITSGPLIFYVFSRSDIFCIFVSK